MNTQVDNPRNRRAADRDGDGRSREKSLFLKINDLAAELKCSRAKAYQLVNSGAVISVRIGGLLRVPRAALEQIAETSGAGAR